MDLQCHVRMCHRAVGVNAGMYYSVNNSPPPLSERAKGGSAVIVSKNMQHEIVNISTILQAFAVLILLDKFIAVGPLHLPHDLNCNAADLQNLISQLPSLFFLLVGDFNTHNLLWGGTKDEVIENIFNSNQNLLFNDGSFKGLKATNEWQDDGTGVLH